MAYVLLNTTMNSTLLQNFTLQSFIPEMFIEYLVCARPCPRC